MLSKNKLSLLDKKKLIIFDFDGVIIDSKINMSLAWNSVRKQLKTKILTKLALYNSRGVCNFSSKICSLFDKSLLFISNC